MQIQICDSDYISAAFSGIEKKEWSHANAKYSGFIIHSPIPVSDFDARCDGRTYRA